MILLNPVVISVIVLCALCLFKFNVLLSVLVAAFVGGIASGIPIFDVTDSGKGIFDILINGMGGNSATALSYILLGAFAAGIAKSGLATVLSLKLSKVLGHSSKYIFLSSIAFIACFSQNLIPVHIAFIPILIPPLIHLMNEMKIDRRGVACALTFGLKAPYITIPMGFGLIFHNIIKDNMASAGLKVTSDQITSVMWIGGLSMLVGLLIAIFILYSRPRTYKDLPIPGSEDAPATEMNRKCWSAVAGAITTGVVAILTKSLAYSALSGFFVMIATGGIEWKDIDETVNNGVSLMGFIAFVMLVAAGYAEVLKAGNGVTELVEYSAKAMQGSKFIAANVMLLIGLIITMGIGSSFSTIPVVAAIYVPLAQKLGFSPLAIILLIGVAAALGDAGSPASDSTLGPTSGLDVDGQHNHIWDTCVPTFIVYDIPLYIGGLIGAMIL